MTDNKMDGDGRASGSTIAALTADLMFAARIRGAAPAAATVHGVEKLLEAAGPDTRLVLVDLQARDSLLAVERVRSVAPAARVVAFAPHVEADLLSAARSAGADQVLTRGAFVRDLSRLVQLE